MEYYKHYEKWHKDTVESKLADINEYKNFVKLHNVLPNKNAKILELGCCMGRLMITLKELEITNIKGVDIEPEFIKIAKNEGLDVIQSDILDFLRNSDEKFDAIYCFDVIEHIDKELQEELFIELNRHLNNEGFVAIKTINALSPTASYFRYIDLTHKLSYTPDTLEFLSKLGGFNEVVIRPEYQEVEEDKVLKALFAQLYNVQFGMKDVILTPNLIAILFKSKEIAEQYKINAPKINNNYSAYHYENHHIKSLVQYYISKMVYKLTFGKIDLYNLSHTKYKFVVFKIQK